MCAILGPENAEIVFLVQITYSEEFWNCFILEQIYKFKRLSTLCMKVTHVLCEQFQACTEPATRERARASTFFSYNLYSPNPSVARSRVPFSEEYRFESEPNITQTKQ